MIVLLATLTSMLFFLFFALESVFILCDFEPVPNLRFSSEALSLQEGL